MGLHKWTKVEDGVPPDLHDVIVQFEGYWPGVGSGGITDLYWYDDDWFNYPKDTVRIVKWMYDYARLPEGFPESHDLRSQVQALPEEDIARLVMVAAQALNDQNWTSEIADLCDVPKDDLEKWSARVVWGDNGEPALQHAAAVALGWFPDQKENK
ncbi:hypothetical protein YA0089_18880 [Pseudomonas viridiflava]|uniref:hypothetical protein n=1 Tax=Pseudomonas viridiflava TaxID=33069 RepID=UPI0018E5DF0B|nr:hypothetical protein [Pseudomonas viridiflava]MBI6725673.1 hypothetical protein [Pseudomonas viridiflava]